MRIFGMYGSLSLRFVKLPISSIVVISWLPLSKTMFEAINEVPMIDVSTAPAEHSVLVFRFVVDELSDVDIVSDWLYAISVFAMVLELAFVESERDAVLQKQPCTMEHFVAALAEVVAL